MKHTLTTETTDTLTISMTEIERLRVYEVLMTCTARNDFSFSQKILDQIAAMFRKEPPKEETRPAEPLSEVQREAIELIIWVARIRNSPPGPQGLVKLLREYHPILTPALTEALRLLGAKEERP